MQAFLAAPFCFFFFMSALLMTITQQSVHVTTRFTCKIETLTTWLHCKVYTVKKVLLFFATSLTNLHFAKMTTQNCCYYITVINATTVVAILAMLWIAVLTCCRFINITVLLWQRIVKLVAKYDKMFVVTRNPFLQCVQLYQLMKLNWIYTLLDVILMYHMVFLYSVPYVIHVVHVFPYIVIYNLVMG